ncbi:hypothetical protein Kpho02_00560 [Kitasatospora phosalacinea]|uniref:DUF4013 domain-containing protein n=1 Tax=Kitasatospora phosalacinea TaxID=2065 RepID=A0A9W6V007_9ACTN|nr:DUF6159 family protein [Kitasatospora phosalacinea]GLW67757.1 hypothetical protein Kpho02_00560 [Kitasatospora phosalacinea]
MTPGIIRTAARVLRRRPALLCFPALGLLVTAVVPAAAWFPLLRGVWQRVEAGGAPSPAQWGAVALVLWAASALGGLCTAALLHSVHELLDGRRPPLRASLAATGRRLPTLLAWSLFSLLVGSVLRTGESLAGLATLFDLLGVSWSLLTFFVLPVIVVEGAGLPASLRRSLALGRRALGRWVVGGLKLFLVTALVALGALAALILAVESDSTSVLLAVLAAVVAVLLLVAVVRSAASGIYRTSLYHEAVASAAPAGDALATVPAGRGGR